MKHCFSKLLREGYTFLFETNSAGAAFYWCNVTEVTNRENGHRYICCNPKIMAIMHLTAEEFRNKVFDYQNEQEWKYKGNLPAIIDFYADWCGPCKMVAPVLEELANEFEDKLVIYK